MENKHLGISVLMSVYKKENPEFLIESVESMINQSRKPDEIVIVEDGPLTQELNLALQTLKDRYKNLVYSYSLKKNVGLGLALKYGVEKCEFTLIARMDTDDVAYSDRLRIQEQAFISDPELDIVGGHISEFMDDINHPISKRYVPLEHVDIVRFQQNRSAFNHMTVMFKKESVLKAGNYEHGLYMEDDLLWHNMLSRGMKSKNLDYILCYVRVGDGMYERRGGFSYFQHYKHARKLMFRRNQISRFSYHYSVIVQFIVALVPTSIRQFIFRKLLRTR